MNSSALFGVPSPVGAADDNGLSEREPLVCELHELEVCEGLAELYRAASEAECVWRSSGDPVDACRWSAAVEDLALYELSRAGESC